MPLYISFIGLSIGRWLYNDQICIFSRFYPNLSTIRAIGIPCS